MKCSILMIAFSVHAAQVESHRLFVYLIKIHVLKWGKKKKLSSREYLLLMLTCCKPLHVKLLDVQTLVMHVVSCTLILLTPELITHMITLVL